MIGVIIVVVLLVVISMADALFGTKKPKVQQQIDVETNSDRGRDPGNGVKQQILPTKTMAGTKMKQ